MRSFTNGHIKVAVTALRTNRGRSFLTMLGVIIGVASVISVVAIGQGVKNQVNGQIHTFGSDLITVRGSSIGASSGLAALSSLNILTPLAPHDYDAVAVASHVGTTVPLALVDGEVHGDRSLRTGVVIGTTENFADILNHSLTYGIFFTSDDMDANANVAVLGAHAAQQIFNENVPIGRSLSFRGQQFVVRGVLDSFETTPLSGRADFNDAVFIPYDIAQSLTNHNAPLYEVLAKPDDPKFTAAATADIQKRLLAAHGGQQDFTVQRAAESRDASSAVLDLLTKLIAGIAAISLLVGGVGIMNVMLVSVTERMHEIGIRKAVGATNRQILTQFMIEATVLSLVGALLGIIGAFIVDLLLRILTDLQPAISWQIVVLAAGVAVAVGIIFGTVPAVKAARKQPIDALRNE